MKTSANITLREITRDTVRTFCNLEPTDVQKQFVAPNSVSMAQAHFHHEAWFRGIYAGDEPVGFVMLEDWTQDAAKAPDRFRETPYLALWRYMIDHRQQGKGYGAAALQLIIDEAKARGVFRELLLSYVPAEGGPRDFYARFGFVETGEMDGIERVMRLALA